MDGRIRYMDIAKGIGIFMVLVGHTFVGFLCTLANSFHMPLFFMISGYFFKGTDDKSTIVKKGWNRLLVPYIFTIVLFVCFSFIMDLKYNSHEAIKWVWGGCMDVDGTIQNRFTLKGQVVYGF